MGNRTPPASTELLFGSAEDVQSLRKGHAPLEVSKVLTS